MTATLTSARPEHTTLLVDLMQEFYAESGHRMDRDQSLEAFRSLLGDESLGRVWLIRQGDDIAGYVVLTLGYSLEYGGRDAFVDDLFLRAPYRGQGLGKLALARVRATCLELGVRALHLEVAHDNPRAASLYRRTGFKDHNSDLLTLRLAE